MRAPATKNSDLQPIEVYCKELPGGEILRFTEEFRIGRTTSCEIQIQNDFVSRVHAVVTSESGVWVIQDLNSSNGLYHLGKQIESLRIDSREVVRLGADGPELTFTVATPSFPTLTTPDSTATGGDEIVAQYADRYFRDLAPGEPVGEHTMYVRRAFAEVQTKQRKAHSHQRWIYISVIATLLVAGGGVSIYAYRLHRETMRQTAVAHDLFYTMKSLDVEIATAERLALATDKDHGEETVAKYESRRQEMQRNYDQFLSTLHIYDGKASEQHRLILRIARIFGECELDMPPDFEREVLKYIKSWQSSGRFIRDIRLAQEKGYTQKITKALLDQGLPVQFFYLAMQESDFDPYISGPLTRKGFAKGMWQFIPETGVKYGLHLGPLVDLARPDPADERDQVEKATDAAARYLNMLYSTDAQASGLLVMACYNWGEDSVLPLVRSLPNNPQQRNFWRLLADHRDQIPQQTYDYVFMITAAAVIGENPRLFGFDLDNPLT
jgi:membrane-bound lytic murein transglycosylase D